MLAVQLDGAPCFCDRRTPLGTSAEVKQTDGAAGAHLTVERLSFKNKQNSEAKKHHMQHRLQTPQMEDLAPLHAHMHVRS